MSLNRLEATADLGDPQARGLLHETLELYSNEIRRLREELNAVRESDRRVAPVPIEAFPVAAGQIYTGAEQGNVADIRWRAVAEIPPGEVECNGAALSRSIFGDLFAKIGTTWGSGDGSTTFNVPNLQRRTLIGRGGTQVAGPGTSVGSVSSAETATLTTNELPAHTHTGPSHTHDLGNHTHDMQNHTHSMAHTHTINTYLTDAAGTVGVPTQHTNNFNAGSLVANSTNASSAANTGGSVANTSVPSVNATSAAGTGATGSAGSGGAFGIMQASAVMLATIRFRLGPADVIQTLPVSWGGVNGQWRLDTVKNFPTTGVTNAHVVISDVNRPEAVVQITAVNGAEAGTSSDNKIIGVMAVPYNFRGWKTEGIKIRTRLNMTGVPAASTASVVLKVSDPISAGAYLSQTHTRTISESGGSLTESGYSYVQLNRDKLGPDWKPGYLFRFELQWSIPKTFASATLEVGFMKISM